VSFQWFSTGRGILLSVTILKRVLAKLQVKMSLSLILCSLSGFSLNGELMMDRMGQEMAFKGIDLSYLYVPAFSLSAGQHARVNFGQV